MSVAGLILSTLVLVAEARSQPHQESQPPETLMLTTREPPHNCQVITDATRPCDSLILIYRENVSQVSFTWTVRRDGETIKFQMDLFINGFALNRPPGQSIGLVDRMEVRRDGQIIIKEGTRGACVNTFSDDGERWIGTDCIANMLANQPIWAKLAANASRGGQLMHVQRVQ